MILLMSEIKTEEINKSSVLNFFDHQRQVDLKQTLNNIINDKLTWWPLTIQEKKVLRLRFSISE
jgi:DNA-directed RNA polymerase sigma subunit (sigma70/sigma32)